MISRLYAWSVAFELLLFFNAVIFGTTSNVSRYLQSAVLIAIVLRWVNTTRRGTVNVGPLRSPLFRNYRLYLAVALFGGFIGLTSGAYHFATTVNQEDLGIYKGVIGPAIRPIVEYVLAVYFFVYFTILPQYLLKTDRQLAYFLNVLRFSFMVCVAAGFVDLVMTAAGRPLIPVSLAEHTFVGLRFHGLAGEPRDAFVYLFFGVAILYLRAFSRGEELGKWTVPVVLFAALMTQSASGLIGVAIFVALYFAYSIRSMSAVRVLRALAIFFVVAGFAALAVSKSERIQIYLSAGSTIWTVLESRTEIPYVMAVQLVNIYPIYDLIVKARHFDLLPILFGSGLGSTSALNSNFFGAFRVLNPHSQLVRTLYETGIVGTWFFITTFTRPVSQLTAGLPTKIRRDFVLTSLLLLGCFLAHRSATGYVFLGAFVAVFRLRQSAESGVPLARAA